jgi:hypothetical protein
VSCRAVHLYVVINLVLPGAAGWRRGPDSAQSSSGARDGGTAAGAATSRGRQDRGGAAGRDLPGRDAGIPLRPVVITAHSQRSSVAAHAVRACPSASRLASLLVQRACLDAGHQARSGPATELVSCWSPAR